MARAFDVGSRLADYVLLGELGRGGFGRVFEAEDLKSGVHVALKVIEADLAEEAGQRAFTRFTSEVHAVRSVEHPNVVRVYDAGRGKDGSGHALGFLAMELLPGGSLRDLVRRDGPVSPARAASIITQAASALGAVHALDVIHRDVKPENILFAADGRAVVVDFGICRIAQGQNLTFTGETLGSMRYLSPEQALGEELDARADEYALAMVAFFLLTGEHIRPISDVSSVFRAVTLGQDRKRVDESAIPAALKPVLTRALATDREARFPTTTELASAFTAAVQSLGAARDIALARPPEAPQPSSTTTSSTRIPTLDPSLLQPVEDAPSDEPLPFAEAIDALQQGITRPTLPPPPVEPPPPDDVSTMVRCAYCGALTVDARAMEEHHAECQLKRWHDLNFATQQAAPVEQPLPSGPELPLPPAPYVRPEQKGLASRLKGWLGAGTGMEAVVDELSVLRQQVLGLQDKATGNLGVRGIDMLVDVAAVLHKSGRDAKELASARDRLTDVGRRLVHLCAIIDVEGMYLMRNHPGTVQRELNLLEAKNGAPERILRLKTLLTNATHVLRTMEQQQEHVMMVVHGLVDTADTVHQAASRITPLEIRRLCTALDAAARSLGAAVEVSGA